MQGRRNPSEGIAAFVYRSAPARVVFGEGSLRHLARELEMLRMKRPLILCTPEQAADAQAVAGSLDGAQPSVFAEAVMHVPVAVVGAAVARARASDADGLVALGGGSATGLAKAMALELPLRILAIPTTYAGSEMTSIYGLTDGGEKRTGRDDRVLPATVLYDPALTLSLPAPLSASSGLNAIAHCVEALYAADGNPVVSLMAEEAIGALARGLPEVLRDPGALPGRERCLYGAWLAGMALNVVSMALHHKLCRVLGGSLNLPHAETHAIVLPYAAAYNAPAAPAAMAAIRRALGAQDAAAGLHALGRALGVPKGLRELGVQASQLDRVADLAASQPYPNPRPLERAAIRELLQQAYEGDAPTPVR